MTIWFKDQADLAVWIGGPLWHLTNTPENELLCDVGPKNEILFEREGVLYLMSLAWDHGPPIGHRHPDSLRGPQPEAGDVIKLTPGRDGRFTPDGKHLLFVRGHETEALGIWRQGYEGGDDSDVYHLDLATLAVKQITDAPGNDEFPVPLDNEGRRFIVLRERDGKPYRPWVVEVVSSKVQRVRRLPMPEGEWPLLFPAVRILDPAPAPGDTSLELDLWLEGDGRLYHTRGAIEPKKLAFSMAVEVPIHREAHPELEGRGSETAEAPAHRFRQLLSAIEGSAAAGPRLKAIPAPDRARFADAIAGAKEPAAAALAWRFCGRLGLPGFDRAHAGHAPEDRIAPTQLTASDVAHARYVALGESLAGSGPPRIPPGTAPLVLDLRAAGGWEPLPEADWAPLAAACPRGRPIVALIDERTWGRGEIVAARLRAECGAIMVGRRTAGLAMETVAVEIPAGLGFPARDFPARVPIGQVTLPSGKVLDGRGVFPEVPVDARIDPTTEPWPAGVREGLTRAVSGSRRRGGARRRPR